MASPLTETGANAVDADPSTRLGHLIRTQFGFVWRLLNRLGLTEAEVEPAAHAVFAAVKQRMGDIRPESERAFLFSSMLHVAARVRRDRGERAPVSDQAPALEDLDEAEQARAILGALLEQMPIELRVVFVLHEIEQLPSSEIADIIGIPLGAVTTRLADAQEDFATHLESGTALSLSLIAAARDELPPAGALLRVLNAAGVRVVAADRESLVTESQAPRASSFASGPERRSPFMLAASWLAIGWLIGLVLASAVWSLRDAATTTTTSPAPVAR